MGVSNSHFRYADVSKIHIPLSIFLDYLFGSNSGLSEDEKFLQNKHDLILSWNVQLVDDHTQTAWSGQKVLGLV